MWNNCSVSFSPQKDIPSLQGKVILVTGANAGLGKQALLELARHQPDQIWLAARNREKAEAAADEVRKEVPDAPIKILELDLASFASVAKAAETFSAQSDRLDLLMLNAGIMGASPGTTPDGYEHHFGTNHMGHALLTKLLLPVLEKTAQGEAAAPVRIVVLSSLMYKMAPDRGIDFNSVKTSGQEMNVYVRYGQSKLANLLFARQMAKLYPHLTTVSVHPGVVQTGILSKGSGNPWYGRLAHSISKRFYTTVEDGAKNQLWASVSDDVKNGEYYEPVGIGGKATGFGLDDRLAEELWNWTEKELEARTPAAAEADAQAKADPDGGK